MRWKPGCASTAPPLATPKTVLKKTNDPRITRRIMLSFPQVVSGNPDALSTVNVDARQKRSGMTVNQLCACFIRAIRRIR
jgi:hypothetical protein